MTIKPTEKLTILQTRVVSGDPHICSDSKPRLNLLFSIYESLVNRDASGVLLPSLARSWKAEDQGRKWTFSLRTDVLFHNGEKLKARDVVASLDRVRDPSVGGSMGTQGVYASYLGDAAFRGLDDHTVEIVCSEPMADLLELLVEMPIAPESALPDLPETHIGSGSYRLEEADEEVLVMEAFPEYWGGQPPVKKVYWRAEPDDLRRVDALLAGEADIVTRVNLEGKRKIEATDKAEVASLESTLCIIFMCNAQSGVCSDRRVRQALNYALDKTEIINTVKGGAATPMNGPLTPLHLGYDPSTPEYPHEPDRARALLADAGYGDGLHLVIDTPMSSPDEAPELSELMARQYAEVGISTEIKEFANREEYAEMVRAKNIDDICCFDSSPLSTFRVLREKIHSGLKGPWWEGYRNPDVDSLIDRAQATVDGERRKALYRRAYRIIRDDAPWIFLYRPTMFWGVGSRAKGWRPGMDGLIRLT